jgi:arginase
VTAEHVLVGAPSAIGIRPYDDGTVRKLDLAPTALRRRDLASRLNADDQGDVLPPQRYADLERTEGRCRNEADVTTFSVDLASRIARVVSTGRTFVTLVGGDCSILLGALLGMHRAGRHPVGLVYIDAHADFATLEESPSGSACSMNLALATGRAELPLATLAGEEPLVAGSRVVHLGRRDDDEPAYGYPALASSGVLDVPWQTIAELGVAVTADLTLARVGEIEAGFWIAFDVDVIDPSLMPAVDSPIKGGLDFKQSSELLRRFVGHPKALGLQLSIYDPALDRDDGAEQLVSMLERAFDSGRGG